MVLNTSADFCGIQLRQDLGAADQKRAVHGKGDRPVRAGLSNDEKIFIFMLRSVWGYELRLSLVKITFIVQ
jgi:hypothetical protein